VQWPFWVGEADGRSVVNSVEVVSTTGCQRSELFSSMNWFFPAKYPVEQTVPASIAGITVSATSLNKHTQGHPELFGK
jgi:hypothetical protein